MRITLLYPNLEKITYNLKQDFIHIDIRRNYFIKDAIREGQKRKFDPKKVIKVMVHGMCT